MQAKMGPFPLFEQSMVPGTVFFPGHIIPRLGKNLSTLEEGVAGLLDIFYRGIAA
jgi:hypothetical protein